MREEAGQREIVVPGDMRATRGRARSAKRAPLGRPKLTSGSGLAGMLATLGAAARFCARRPGETAGSVVVLGAVAYVSVNALGFQAGRHPAPILPQTVAQTTPAPLSPSLPKVATKPVEPAHRDATETPRAPKDAARAGAQDPIAELIRGPGETTASVTPKPDKDVARAQRALTKLGYGTLKDDGVMGGGTKAALEKFEREHKLPVKGQAAGRTLKELVARADQKKG